jgi:uncharacterized protein with PIN domain
MYFQEKKVSQSIYLIFFKKKIILINQSSDLFSRKYLYKEGIIANYNDFKKKYYDNLSTLI